MEYHYICEACFSRLDIEEYTATGMLPQPCIFCGEATHLNPRHMVNAEMLARALLKCHMALFRASMDALGPPSYGVGAYKPRMDAIHAKMQEYLWPNGPPRHNH